MNFDLFERYRPIIDDWDAFVAALRRPLPTCVWTNTLRTTPERLAQFMRDNGMPHEPLGWDPRAFKIPNDLRPGNRFEYAAGLFHIQEEASLLPVALLEPAPGERVLDMCAAPGNKTVQIATTMQNRGTVVANDRDYRRMRAVGRALERLGVLNTSLTVYDAANLPGDAGPFDRILADVPCSCEGTSRKNPEVLELTGGIVPGQANRLQKAILRKALQLCRPGGRIVYSTCTYAPEENELVIDEVLSEMGSDAFHLLDARIPGFRSAPGLTSWMGRTLHPDLARAMRVYPHHNDTGGFFVAVIERAAAPADAAPLDTDRLTGPTSTVDALPWSGILGERFGIDPSTFEGLSLVQTSHKYLQIVNSDHLPPPRPTPDTLGMPFMRTKMQQPKLTTAAAMAFGPAATRNVVHTTREQCDAYLSRRDIVLSAEQAARCTGRGYVLVAHEEWVLGVGFYRPMEPASSEAGQPPGGIVQSLFPTAWAIRPDQTAFGGPAMSHTER